MLSIKKVKQVGYHAQRTNKRRVVLVFNGSNSFDRHARIDHDSKGQSEDGEILQYAWTCGNITISTHPPPAMVHYLRPSSEAQTRTHHSFSEVTLPEGAILPRE